VGEDPRRGDESDGDDESISQQRKPEQPPVDGPSAGSEGEEEDRDVSASSSYDQPGR
jgi:hypothetical protein